MIRNLWVATLVAISIIGASLGISTDAEAACAATSAQMKDNASTTFLMGLAADPNGNCSSYFTPIQGGAVLGATNGLYTNLLQGNAVIASSNPLFSQLTAGSAIVGKFGIDQTTQGTTNFVTENLTQMGGTAIAAGCTAALNSFSTSIPSTVCPVFGMYAINTNGNGAAPSGNSSPVVLAFSASLTLQNAVVANANGAPLVTNGYGGAVLHVVCSVACSGGTTINFEASFDGTTYVAIQGTPVGGGAPVSTATTTGDFAFNISGYTDLRARISAYSAGTITVTGFATSFPSLQPATSPITIAAGGVASGALASGSIASGALASGSISSGAAVSGAFVAGSIADLSHGQGTMAASVPVAIASNQSAIPVTLTSTTVTGNVAAVGPTAVGSANANPPVVIGGTATGAAGQNVQGLSIVAPSVAPVTATNTAVVVDLRPDSPGIITLGPAAVANSVPQTISSQYPTNATTTTPTPVGAVATGTTGAVVATFAATASVTNFLCEFDVSIIGGTASGTVTIAGLNGGSRVYNLSATATGVLLSKSFSPCLPASGTNTAITITTSAFAAATANDVNSSGYRL
jgi:hypothetical protein